ncbi:MAG TPA: hypothetical protein PLE61_15440 [Vicinamibacterales bacterium]|nr:hypothetical protein [Vicinamibacterales bacterium]
MPEMNFEQRAARLYRLCVQAGCSETQLTILRLRLSRVPMARIGESLRPAISHAAVAKHLGRAKARTLKYCERQAEDERRGVYIHKLPHGFTSWLAFARWLWRTMQGQVHEDGVHGRWRKPTIGHGPAFDPLCDDRGNPVHFRVRPFMPEDLAEQREAQSVGGR